MDPLNNKFYFGKKLKIPSQYIFSNFLEVFIFDSIKFFCQYYPPMFPIHSFFIGIQLSPEVNHLFWIKKVIHRRDIEDGQAIPAAPTNSSSGWFSFFQ